MAYPSIQLDSHFNSSVFTFQVAMEHFEEPKRLQGAMECSDDCAAIFQDSVRTTQSQPLTVSPAVEDLSLTQNVTDAPNPSTNGKQDHVHAITVLPALFSAEEGESLGEFEDNIAEFLEETKQAVHRTKKIKNSVMSNKETTMERTRKLFDTFRNRINEKEQQVLEDIKRAADNKEKAIKVKCFLFVFHHKLEGSNVRF